MRGRRGARIATVRDDSGKPWSIRPRETRGRAKRREDLPYRRQSVVGMLEFSILAPDL